MNIEPTQLHQIADVARDLAVTLASTHPKVTRLENNPIPKRESLVELIGQLKSVLFPGFQQLPHGDETDLNRFLNRQLESLAHSLSGMIAQALVLDRRFAESENCDALLDEPTILPSDQNLIEQGRELAIEFLQGLPEIRDALARDVRSAYVGDPACRNLFEVVLCYPGLMAITVHRLAHRLYTMEIPFLPRMMAEWVHGETGIDIHPGATIGDHFFIDHGTGVVIGETCVIGSHVKVYQGVTLGALSFDLDEHGHLIRSTKRHPTIEDRVIIYANATVLGGDTVVGHDSVVGSSVWLTRSVPPNTTVMMERPKLRLRSDEPGDFSPPLDYQI